MAIGNQKSKIPEPTRYREVVLTSLGRGMSVCDWDHSLVATGPMLNTGLVTKSEPEAVATGPMLNDWDSYATLPGPGLAFEAVLRDRP